MYIEKLLPYVGEWVTLREDKILYSAYGKFVGPHDFEVVEISPTSWELEDRDGHRAAGSIWNEEIFDY